KLTYFSSKILAGAKSYRLVQFHGSSSGGSCQCGRKKRGEPNQMLHHDASACRQSSVGAYGVATARSFQNASSASAALPGLPAMIAPLKAPMETPATISGWMAASSNALTTPHSKAPKAPPPCKIRTVWVATPSSAKVSSESLSFIECTLT